jgi:hypothetical protein
MWQKPKHGKNVSKLCQGLPEFAGELLIEMSAFHQLLGRGFKLHEHVRS